MPEDLQLYLLVALLALHGNIEDCPIVRDGETDFRFAGLVGRWNLDVGEFWCTAVRASFIGVRYFH